MSRVMGISDDRTQNVLWRLANGQLDGYISGCLWELLAPTIGLRDKCEQFG